MKTTHIAFIGGGNMARSLIGGLIADGCDPRNLWVADPSGEQREVLQSQFGVNTTADNSEAADKTNVLVMAVKPQVLHKNTTLAGSPRSTR